MTKKLLDLSGVGSKRLHLEWVSSAEAKRFTEVAAKITDSVKNKGRLEVERLKIPLEAALMVVENASLRWLVGKELSIVSKGDVYGRKVDTESYEKSLDLLVEREYQNSLICIAIKNGFSSVRDISRETGIDLLRVSYLLADLERTGRVEFLQMTDRVPSFAVI